MINLAAFFVRHWRLILPLLTALLIAGAYYSGRFTGYQVGKSDAAIACAEDKAQAAATALEQAEKSSRDLERNMKNAKNKAPDATDDSLRALGILRDNADR